MATPETALTQSCAAYRRWHSALGTLESELAQGDEPSVQLLLELDQAQQAARQADLALRPWLGGGEALPAAALAEYRDLLRNVADQVTVLRQRAQTLRALAAAELTELRGNKVAVSGYRPMATLPESAFTTRG